MRLGLLYNDKIAVKNKKNAQFVIEEMGKKTAEIFSRLQLGKYPKLNKIFVRPTDYLARCYLILMIYYKLRFVS